MTLDQVEQLLLRAKTVHEVFGDNVASTYWVLAAACHPDKFCGTPNEERARNTFKKLSDWQDLANSPPKIIESSSSRAYEVHGLLGSGDLCDVHFATSGTTPYVIKAPRVPGGNQLMAKEAEVLRQLGEKASGNAYEKYFPRLEDSFVVKNGHDIRVNVFAWREGLYSAEAIKAKHDTLHGRHIGWMFKRVLEILGFVHSQAWIHGSITPAHLLYEVANHGLSLCDWLHSIQPGRNMSIVPAKYKPWYPQEIILKKEVATPAVDIYMAAKAMLWLSGGDPVSNTFPDAIPKEMRSFFGACLLESPRMRRADAWGLHDDFSKLLESLYGPPRFISLDM